MTRPGRRCRGEAGVVGGFEALPFGFLLFVVGSMLLLNVWAVIDAELAVAAGAREAARAYVESPGPRAGDAAADAAAAAVAAVEGHGRDGRRASVEPVGVLSFARCARVTFAVTYEVPLLTLPWIGGWGGGVIETTARHSEVVDPYRSGVPLAVGSSPVACA